MPNRTRKETDPVHTLTDEDIVSTTLTQRSRLAQTLTDAELDAVAAAGSQAGSTTDGRLGESHVHVQRFGSKGGGTVDV
jgi:hypothetical protein